MQFLVEIFYREKWKLKIFLMYYIIMLHKLILQNLTFNFCMDKKSFKLALTCRWQFWRPINRTRKAQYIGKTCSENIEIIDIECMLGNLAAGTQIAFVRGAFRQKYASGQV